MKKLSLLAATCLSLISMQTYAHCGHCHECAPCNIGTQANSVSFTVGTAKTFFASKRRLNNAGMPFFALGYNFTNNWGIEALAGFFNTTFKGELDTGGQTNGNLVLFDILYHFNPFASWQPYLLAGVGVTGLSSNRTDANNQGNINAGVGLEYHVNEVVSFKADVRDIYTMVGGKNDIFVGAGVNISTRLC